MEIVKAGESPEPYTAGSAVARVSEHFTAKGIPLAPEVKARVGKGAKALISAGFDPQIVVAAMIAAVSTRMFGSTETIAQEMALAQGGALVTREQYRRAIEDAGLAMRRAEDPYWQMTEERRRAREQ